MEEIKNKNFNIKVWLKLKRFIVPYKHYLIGIGIFMVVAAVIDIAMPLLQKYAVDHFIMKSTTEGMKIFTGFYVVLLIGQVVTVTVFARLAIIVEMRLAHDLREDIFVHLQRLSLSYYNTTSVGYIMSRILSDTNKIGSMVSWGVLDIFWSLAYVSFAFITMFILNFKLACLVLLVVPIMAIATVYFQSKLLKANRKIRKTNAEMTGEINEAITGAKTSKTLVIEKENLAHFTKTTERMYKETYHMVKLNAIFIPIITFSGSMATAIVLTRGGYLSMNQLLELGTLSAFLSYSMGIFEPIQQLARVFSEFVSLQANIERFTGILETNPGIEDTPDVVARYGDTIHPQKENWEVLEGNLEFKNVFFQYPDGDEEILSKFNLKIPKGMNLAIVGETGAGKSTLVNLACRFFEPTQGEILIDGKDYRQRSQLWLHSNIGYVLQNPHLFSGTIADNIRYGKLDATDLEIETAAQVVRVDKIVATMGKGYDSEVGENGDNLSTGQKQLISLARAIIANPSIFVLDEATASIDTYTESLIQEAIQNVMKNRTSLIIAHRLSTIRKADMIIVFKEKEIVERGNHEELMKNKGEYYSLYTKQFEEEKTLETLKKEMHKSL